MLLNESHETEKICIDLVIFSLIHDLNYMLIDLTNKYARFLINNSINSLNIVKYMIFWGCVHSHKTIIYNHIKVAQSFKKVWLNVFDKKINLECVHIQKLINNDIKMALNSNKYFPHVQIFSNKQLFYFIQTLNKNSHSHNQMKWNEHTSKILLQVYIICKRHDDVNSN